MAFAPYLILTRQATAGSAASKIGASDGKVRFRVESRRHMDVYQCPLMTQSGHWCFCSISLQTRQIRAGVAPKERCLSASSWVPIEQIVDSNRQRLDVPIVDGDHVATDHGCANRHGGV